VLVGAGYSPGVTRSVLRELRVPPGSKVRLSSFSTDTTFSWDKEWAVLELERVKARLDVLQQRLFAEGERSVLLVLQAMDAAGKDGTIREILSGLNPAGVHVVSFKAPGGPEAAHDYLWRIHASLPARGHIGVFNRSHYEDVLVVRVKELAPKAVWSKRFEHIREFEQMIAEEGTRVVKVFLHVSKEEQRERLQERLDNPEKRWKFRLGDLEARARWDDYQAAYEEALARCSPASAPWFVIPANRKWFRDLAVARIVAEAADRMAPRFPDPEEDLTGVVIPQ
jgi:PPK2 family polyphosphate:nucleotide phosphotransferase